VANSETKGASSLCAIALGSNLGDSKSILIGALDQLHHSADVTLVDHSSLYQTAPVGPPQPDYLNCCAMLRTALSPQAMMERLLTVEANFGRVRQERWGPRRLDLDLLLYDDAVVKTEMLEVPHPRMRERAFVLVPLAEIAPDWIDPVSGCAIADLVKTVDCSGVQRLPH
jgi:2-amino-4-hydroxy-6-hydroxymethyldihydropteridine diphosphokinase